MNKTTVAMVTASVLTLALATSGAAQPFGYGGPPGYGHPGYDQRGYGNQGYSHQGYSHQGGPGFTPPPQFADPTDMLEARFDWMRDRLDIGADQMDAWHTFTHTVLARMEAGKAARKALRRERPKDPMEMDQRRIDMISERLTGMKAVAEARAALFEVLTEHQREEATDLMMGRRGGHDGDRRGDHRDDRRDNDQWDRSGWYWGY